MTEHEANGLKILGAAAIARAFMALMGPILLLLSAYGLWKAFGGDWQQYLWPAVGLGAGVPWVLLSILGGRFKRMEDIDRFCFWMIGGVLFGAVWLVVAGVVALLVGAIW